jgi:hypothetical protein
MNSTNEVKAKTHEIKDEKSEKSQPVQPAKTEPAKQEPAPVKLPSRISKKKWSGLDMWACSRCGGTFFSEKEAIEHSCNARKSS